ncbi:GGDEF domain-containing protein [Denitromonas iodatirespirans]|uniref:diguanylate cyclase n=1 Tax=Denitromonas iodatirespirans TaxID=2795389 RepID=A0A944H8A1_DENI1|nr:GGDEF domain-containing protein [Denitromonas iodatirespirans]MBT0961165.1 GGDEF domain-containing protein [Denitromonas iodatirespirans]
MPPLQRKLTAALLVTGLASTLSLGGIAHWMLMRDFQQSVMDEAFAHFSADALAYLQRYGSWAEATRYQPFPEFVRQRHRPPMPGDAPRPRQGFDRRGAPPFHFLIMDPQGRILKGLDGLPEGTLAPPEVRATARPIRVGDRVELLASPQGEPVLTRRDEDYLAAMRQALLTGMAVAVVLALALGLLMGRRMSTSLQLLTHAIRGMQKNRELPRQVTVRSGDEIGELAQAFNAMNAELTQAHRDLREYAELTASQSARLKELSIRDPLTDLFNRRHFDEQANSLYQQAMRYGHPLSVMVGDLDFFKQINDDFSHAVGDEVLRRVAVLLRDGTRKADLVARYGGEEFVILFPESTLAQAAHCCEKLRLAIEIHPWHEVHPQLRVTMSMGLSDTLAAGSVEKMIAEADSYLYQAKHGGRNRVLPAA